MPLLPNKLPAGMVTISKCLAMSVMVLLLDMASKTTCFLCSEVIDFARDEWMKEQQ